MPFWAFVVVYGVFVANYRVVLLSAVWLVATVTGPILLPFRWRLVLSDQTLTYRGIRTTQIPRGAIREVRRVLSPNGVAFERLQVIGADNKLLLDRTSLFDPADILRLQEAIAADHAVPVPPPAPGLPRIIV